MLENDRFRALSLDSSPQPARQIVDRMDLRAQVPPDRPRVVAVMVSAPDGRATVGGRSGGLGSPADRDVLLAMRGEADALLVGSRTLRIEGYGTLLGDEHRAAREARGLPREPRLVTLSRDLSHLPVAEAPIFQQPGAPITVFTTSTEAEVPLPEVAADLEVVRLSHEALDLATVLDVLRTSHGAQLVVTEGGPTLLHSLVSVGLLDDLLHTVAPMLIAGDGRTMLAGDAFPEPARLRVRGVHQAADHLFVHYAVVR